MKQELKSNKIIEYENEMKEKNFPVAGMGMSAFIPMLETMNIFQPEIQPKIQTSRSFQPKNQKSQPKNQTSQPKNQPILQKMQTTVHQRIQPKNQESLILKRKREDDALLESMFGSQLKCQVMNEMSDIIKDVERYDIDIRNSMFGSEAEYQSYFAKGAPMSLSGDGSFESSEIIENEQYGFLYSPRRRYNDDCFVDYVRQTNDFSEFTSLESLVSDEPPFKKNEKEISDDFSLGNSLDEFMQNPTKDSLFNTPFSFLSSKSETNINDMTIEKNQIKSTISVILESESKNLIEIVPDEYIIYNQTESTIESGISKSAENITTEIKINHFNEEESIEINTWNIVEQINSLKQKNVKQVQNIKNDTNLRICTEKSNDDSNDESSDDDAIFKTILRNEAKKLKKKESRVRESKNHKINVEPPLKSTKKESRIRVSKIRKIRKSKNHKINVESPLKSKPEIGSKKYDKIVYGSKKRMLDYIDMDDLSRDQQKALDNRERNENEYFYRFTDGPCYVGKWTKDEVDQLIQIKSKLPKLTHWGVIGKYMKVKRGYQCQQKYDLLVKNGIIE